MARSDMLAIGSESPTCSARPETVWGCLRVSAANNRNRAGLANTRQVRHTVGWEKLAFMDYTSKSVDFRLEWQAEKFSAFGRIRGCFRREVQAYRRPIFS